MTRRVGHRRWCPVLGAWCDVRPPRPRLRKPAEARAASAGPRQSPKPVGEDLYEDLAAKAVALAHSLIQNHPFLDGNKRVGAMAMELFLLANGHELRAIDEGLEEVALSVARGEIAAEALAIWIRQRIREIPFSGL